MTEWARKVRTGESLRIPAAAYNAFVDAAVAARRGSLAADAGNRGESSTRILAINTGAAPIPRWHGCVILGAAEGMTSADGKAVVEVALEDIGKVKDQKAGLFAIAAEAIFAGGVGSVVVSGVTIAATEDALDEFAATDFRGEFEEGLLRPSPDGTLRVLGMVDEPTSAAIGYALVRMDSGSPSSPSFLARISDADPIANNDNRWRYTWVEVQVDTDGNFVDRSNGRTSADLGKAYNTVEAFNDGDGVEGPGWDLGNAPGTFAIQPIQQCVVEMRLEPIDGGAFVPLFSMANVLDGECEEEGSG